MGKTSPICIPAHSHTLPVCTYVLRGDVEGFIADMLKCTVISLGIAVIQTFVTLVITIMAGYSNI